MCGYLSSAEFLVLFANLLDFLFLILFLISSVIVKPVEKSADCSAYGNDVSWPNDETVTSNECFGDWMEMNRRKRELNYYFRRSITWLFMKRRNQSSSVQCIITLLPYDYRIEFGKKLFLNSKSSLLTTWCSGCLTAGEFSSNKWTARFSELWLPMDDAGQANNCLILVTF